MKKHALIIEPDPSIREEITEEVRSLGHEFSTVKSQQEGLDFLRKFAPLYTITGLLIPVDFNSKSKTPENCLLFLDQAKKFYAKPIIVTASREFVSKGYVPPVMRAGAFDMIDKPNPPMGRSLVEAVLEAMRIEQYRSPEQKEIDRKNAIPFMGGSLAFFPDRIELDGLTITDPQTMGLAEPFLKLLSNPFPGGKLPRFSQAALSCKLNTTPGAIRTMVLRLRRNIFVIFKKARNIMVQKHDVIVTSHGYYLSEKITVNRNSLIISPKPFLSNISEYSLTNRQLKIISLFCRKQRVTRQDIEQFAGVSESSVKRDLLVLKNYGLIVFVGHGLRGYWVLNDEYRQQLCQLPA